MVEAPVKPVVFEHEHFLQLFSSKRPGDRLAFLLFPVERPELFDAVLTDEAGAVHEIRVKQDEPGTPWVWGAMRMPGAVLPAPALATRAKGLGVISLPAAEGQPVRSVYLLAAGSDALFAGFAVNQTGFWISHISLQGLMVQLSDNDPFQVGLLFSSLLLPALVLAPIAGVVADRFHRKTILVLCNLTVAALAGTLALIAWHGASPLAIVILGYALGSTFAVAGPASNAIAANAVETDDLARLVSSAAIAKYQITPRSAIVYLRGLEQDKPLALRYRLRATMPVKVTAAPVRAYEYYNPERCALSGSARLVVVP